MRNEQPTRETILHTKAKTFLEEKSIVHVKLFDGTFYNGRLFEVTDKYIIIHDRKIGRQKVFLIELKLIEEYEVEGQ